MKTKILYSVVVVAVWMTSVVGQQRRPEPPSSPRLYIFDCGTIKGLPVTSFGFKEGEVPRATWSCRAT